MRTKTCPSCNGHGVVSDYGALGEDFYGATECKTCQGSGWVRARDDNGRFL